ncbi:MAG: FHA domain-containing protein [Chloroflexi bacterium]|nr:FHA domain-containing protein [Chloroflexota bacterium]
MTTEELLRTGIALAKAGKSAHARKILGKVVKDDPRLVMGWLWLAGVVKTKDQQRYCLERVLQLNPQNQVVKRILTQLETAKPKVAAGSKYFVAHRLTSRNGDNLKKAIDSALGPLGYAPYYADIDIDSSLRGQSLLLKICQKIFLTSFGIFELSPENLNSYLEMGIAIGLNRPIVAIAQKKTPLPPVLQGHNIVKYTDYADLQAQLTELCDQGFPPTARPAPDHCYFCDRVCESMSAPPDEHSYLVLNRSKLLWRSLMRSLTPHLAQYDLSPAYLSDRAIGPMLCDVRRKIFSSQFALCHLGTLSDESSFLALGMAIGGRVPWILLSKSGPESIPSALEGSDIVEYATLADIQIPLTDTLRSFLGGITSGAAAKSDKTALLSLPFWVQLEDWISRVKHAAQTSETIESNIRVIQYEGQKLLSRHTVPKKGLLFGRSSDCTVPVENQSVSAQHFRILKGRTGKYFIEDLNSRNGTFLNGTRISPRQRMELHLNDTIRIPGARFLVWDGRPVPAEKPAKIYGDTSLLPPILKVEISDVPPPDYLNTWDHSMVLTILPPNSRRHSMFEVQAYYPMGKILSKLVDLLNLPKNKYSFRIEDKLISNSETPLSAGLKRSDVLVMVPMGPKSSKVLSSR